jgi:hypothetical protein
MKTCLNFCLVLLLAMVTVITGCGGLSNTPVSTLTVSSTSVPGADGSSQTGTLISNIQTSSGNWQSWVQLAPNYANCTTPCSGTSIEEIYAVADPSLSGNATMFELNAASPYADALFSAQLIGQNSQQIPDAAHSLLPTVHNFIYDSYFYVTRASITQELEFDVSMYMNGVGMIWGNQCNYLGDGNWDIWDNVNQAWVSAGVPCKFADGWNHVTINMQREADNSLLYESIALNGTTYAINKTYPAGVAAAGWWGVTANYQMDGNAGADTNTTYVDNFSVTYW